MSSRAARRTVTPSKTRQSGEIMNKLHDNILQTLDPEL